MSLLEGCHSETAVGRVVSVVATALTPPSPSRTLSGSTLSDRTCARVGPLSYSVSRMRLATPPTPGHLTTCAPPHPTHYLSLNPFYYPREVGFYVSCKHV
ncbi:hypothetical protein Pmani_011921 [Petrolisthes manimaculis]|uniref:Uncharacterized protein n=1 Tax=Petrolisthes manimaculis TaxID=1843537 RepID=A0AAE1PYF9_9EUCA|nr:hypothetical protein Pmani_011921 [Petrolisthes manimaculis]